MGIGLGRTCLLLILTSLTACSFIRERGDEGERSYQMITRLLDDMATSRASGMPAATWWDSHRCNVAAAPAETWEGVEAALYAARSASRIRHVPYVSGSLTFLEIGFEGIGGGQVGSGVALVLVGVIASPLELITLPAWMIAGPFHEAGVSEQHLREAVQDLMRARDLGYGWTRIEQETLFGAPTWGYLHLDELGYDRAWLRSRE